MGGWGTTQNESASGCSTGAEGRTRTTPCMGVTPGLQKDINRAIIYIPESSHTYIQQNEQIITAHIT